MTVRGIRVGGGVGGVGSLVLGGGGGGAFRWLASLYSCPYRAGFGASWRLSLYRFDVSGLGIVGRRGAVAFAVRSCSLDVASLRIGFDQDIATFAIGCFSRLNL